MKAILVAGLVVLTGCCCIPTVSAQQMASDSTLKTWASWKPYQRDTANKHSRPAKRQKMSLRITDSNIVRSGFMSPDRYWERYPQWSPYQYAAANPLRYTDPSGDTIVFAGANPSRTETQFNTAVNYLRSNGVDVSNIDKLRSATGIVVLEPITDYGNHYSSPSRTIYWNPTAAAATPDGKALSPATILYHEMAGHAYQHMFRPTRYARDAATADNQYETAEERRVIEQFEHPAAGVLGEGHRENHGIKSFFEVTGPTSVVPVVPNPEPPLNGRNGKRP